MKKKMHTNHILQFVSAFRFFILFFLKVYLSHYSKPKYLFIYLCLQIWFQFNFLSRFLMLGKHHLAESQHLILWIHCSSLVLLSEFSEEVLFIQCTVQESSFRLTTHSMSKIHRFIVNDIIYDLFLLPKLPFLCQFINTGWIFTNYNPFMRNFK